MPELRIHFYLAGKDGHIIDNLISAWTWLFNMGTPPISHVEIEFMQTRQCFSAATRGGRPCVRLERSEVVLKHPERWLTAQFHISEQNEKTAWLFAWAQEGKGYDFLGIFGFLIPWPIQDKKRWYCSEICSRLLYKIGVIPKKYIRISPRRLYRVVKVAYNIVKYSELKNS